MRSSLFGKKLVMTIIKMVIRMKMTIYNTQLNMKSFIFHIVDYFINFFETNWANIDVVSVASNMNVTTCDSDDNNNSSINEDDVTLSQLCG